MPKKKRFDQTPNSFSRIRPGDKMSFRVPGEDLIPIPGDACNDLEIPDIINLEPEDRGRKDGEPYIYTPDQTYNYLSVTAREDKSFNLLPAYIKEDEDAGTVTYGFCSQESPNGFWEVVVSLGVTATFIEFDPPFLTILCPRPFRVSELTTLNSDSNVYKWTQITGSRTVFILPDNVKDPIIDIQSTCFTGECDTNTQDPIRIRVETDNPLVFTDLIILNRCIDNFDGQGYINIPFTQVQCRRLTTVYRVPEFEQKVFCWEGSPITITWAPPACNAEYIYQYRLEQLIPPYTVVATTSGQTFTLSANTQYRLLADFNILGVRQETSVSEPLVFRYDPQDIIKTVFADDSAHGAGYANINSNYTVDIPGVKLLDVLDSAHSNGYANIASEYITAVPGVQARELIDDFAGAGYVNISSAYIVNDLGGIVIG